MTNYGVTDLQQNEMTKILKWYTTNKDYRRGIIDVISEVTGFVLELQANINGRFVNETRFRKKKNVHSLHTGEQTGREHLHAYHPSI